MQQRDRIRRALSTGYLSVPIAIGCFVLLRLFSGIDLLTFDSLAVMIIQITIALLLLQTNYTFTIIQERTMLPAIVYLLLAGTNPLVFSDWVSNIMALGFLLCLNSILSSFREKQSSIYLFNITFLLTIGSLIWVPLLLFIPLFWFGAYYLQSLSLRSFTASLLGVFVVILVLFSYFVFCEGDGWKALLDSLRFSFAFDPDILVDSRVIYTGILTLFALLHLSIPTNTEKIKNRIFLNFLCLSVLVCGIILLFFDENGEKTKLISFSYVALAIIIAHYFTSHKSKISFYILIFSFVFYVATYLLDVYHIDLTAYIPSWISLN